MTAYEAVDRGRLPQQEEEKVCFGEMPEVLLNGFRRKIEEDIAQGRKIHYLDPSLCFAFYDAELLRSRRYGFFAIMGLVPEDHEYSEDEVWSISNSVDMSFKYAGHAWDRKALQDMEEEIKNDMIDLCVEFEGKV